MTVTEAALDTVETLRPGDEAYADAARVLFATGEPALVVRPGSAEEVAAALAHAVTTGLPLSVRSGGHSLLGHGTNTGGLVIDLARLDGVEIVDPDRRRVRVGAGASWGQVAAALDPFGWCITAGDTAGVGVGGLTLGGGIGWLVRRDGLAIDNLVRARVVTADGRLVTASAQENPDLFWALRGGGGNFGVVVDFDFVATTVGAVHFGWITYRLDGDPEATAATAGLLGRWRDAMRRAPDALASTMVLGPRVPDAAPSATVLVCYAADPGASVEDADLAIEPLLELGTVAEAAISESRYAAILEEVDLPPGLRLVSRNTLLPVLGREAIAAIAAFHASSASPAIAVRSLGGAFGRVPPHATAFAHRDAEAMAVGMLMVPESTPEATIAESLLPWHAVAARGEGTYLNFQGSATDADLEAAYPAATLARLAQVKRTYDPTNVFALNHNIGPAGPGEGPAA